MKTVTIFVHDISKILNAKCQSFVQDISTTLGANGQNVRARYQDNSQRITATLYAQDMNFHHQQP
jgi:hypothetical protein